MALTKIGSGGIENVTNAANATFLTIDASEQITVASEGGAVTTSVQQGLAKVWSRFNGSSFGAVDSFNQASLTDAGTGIYQVNMTNPYSANEGAHGGFSGAYHAINRSSGSASQIELGTYNSSHSSVDESRCFVTSHGDLA